MEFEDMKVIWDSQNDEPLYAVNEDGLQAMLRKKTQAFKRLVFWQEAQTYGSSLFVVVVISIALIGYFTGGLERMKGIPMGWWDAAALFVGVACWMQSGLNVYVARRKQNERETRFSETLRDEIDRDLERVDFEIATRKNLVRGFIPPYLGSFLFNWVIFRASGVEWFMLPLVVVMVGAFLFELNSQRRLVRNKLIPRKEELESLRDKLANAEH
jgi:hypothetical protein